MVQMYMQYMIGGQVGPSMYLDVWKDSPIKLVDVTSATDVARSRVTSAPSAPRHWQALQRRRQPLPAKC